MANLTDLPSHSGVGVGDTVETSGYSKSFPRGLIVGRICSVEETDNSSPEVLVSLSVDFSRIGFVYVDTTVAPEELQNL